MLLTDHRSRRGVRRAATAAAAAALGMLLGACNSGLAGDGEFVSVPGGQVHLWCDGEDAPTIMFLSAIGGDDALVPIAERLKGDANVCFYDRPGDGDTQPPDKPRDAAADAADLHELLAAAGIEPPVVLVAHSYGGLVALVAAAEHPEDIVGLVMVDASQPDAEAAFYTVMTEAQRAYFDGRLDDFPYVDWPTSVDQARRAIPEVPDIPATVITATRSFLDPCDPQLPCEELQGLWLDAQATYENLTSQTKHVLADTSHYVQNDDPDLVVREIRALLDRVRPDGQ